MRGFGAIIKMLECIPASLLWVHCFFAAGASEKPLLFNVLYIGQRKGRQNFKKFFKNLLTNRISGGIMMKLSDVARWSSGQDGGLSRRKREFDSPTGHHVGMDYIPFKKPSHSAGLFSYHFVIPPFPHKTLQGKLLRGPCCRENEPPGRMDCIPFKMILSRLVDTFISKISLTMLPVPKPHNTACVLSWEEARRWQSRSSGYSSS